MIALVARTLGLLMLCAVAMPAVGAQVTLNPVAFNTMYEDNPTRASGQSTSLFLGPIASGSPRRILLRFDPSTLPPTAVVTSVQLRLAVNRAAIGSEPSDTIAVHRLLASWGQGTAAGPGGGNGTQASPGDATWLARFYNSPPATPSLLWSQAGGDFNATPSYLAAMGLGSGTLTLASTPAMVADVQSWRSNPAGNHGWILVGPEGPEFSQKARRIDGVSLIVDYELTSASVPEMGVFPLLLALALLCALGYRYQVRA